MGGKGNAEDENTKVYTPLMTFRIWKFVPCCRADIIILLQCKKKKKNSDSPLPCAPAGTKSRPKICTSLWTKPNLRTFEDSFSVRSQMRSWNYSGALPGVKSLYDAVDLLTFLILGTKNKIKQSTREYIHLFMHYVK